MATDDDDMQTFDAVVIGGGAAGLSATLTLARANRKVLLLDGGPNRNSFSKTIHNVLGFDGMDREAYIAHVHQELAQYENVYHWDRFALNLVPAGGAGFAVELEGDEFVATRAV